MAARSHQHHYANGLPLFSGPTANSLEPHVFEFSNNPDLDVDVALSHWVQLPASDLDELYAPLQPALTPSHQLSQYAQVNYVQPHGHQCSPCTCTQSPSAAVLHPQCLRDHAFAGDHGGTAEFVTGRNMDHTPLQYTPHIIAPNADSTVIESVVMQAHQQHSVELADKFKSTAPIMGGGCLSEPNHMEGQLLLHPLIKPNVPYMRNSFALEEVPALSFPSLPGLVPVSPTSGASTPHNMNSYTSATFEFESSAMAGSSFSVNASSSSTYFGSLLPHLEWKHMNGVIPLSSTPSVNKNDKKFMEEMSSADDGSEVTFRVETENINLEDGYTWRKYGQKEIKKAAFKKSYFRCVRHDKGCKVLKRIQRCSDDLQDYIDFTYTGRHNHPL